VVLRVRNAVHGKHLHDQVGKAYQELKQLEEMRDNLIHMIVHDLRSPLTGALGFLELLQMTAGDKLDQEESESLDSIYKIVEIVMAMINSVLDVNRLENKQMPLELQPNDLVPLMNRILEMLTPKISKHIVIFDQADEQIHAHCNPAVTQRVFINLVMNAAAFAPVNSEIAIRIVPTPDEVVVQVKDNGPGLSKEDKERIFDKFAFAKNNDRKQHSVGLGLAFCKLAMEAQQGAIGVSSKPGQGSTFWLSFPAVK
jgi:two-component system, sensor histidine kinase and response regulator